MSKRDPAPQFGLALPIKRNSDGVIVGLKIYQYKEDSRNLDFENGVLIWKSDLDTLWSGARKSVPVFVNVPLPAKPTVKAR